MAGVWLILGYGVGLLGGAMLQVSKLMRGQRPASPVRWMTAILTVPAILLISFCAYRWQRGYAGLSKGRKTFLISLAVVIGFNIILVVCEPATQQSFQQLKFSRWQIASDPVISVALLFSLERNSTCCRNNRGFLTETLRLSLGESQEINRPIF